jgi:hypothetical protein
VQSFTRTVVILVSVLKICMQYKNDCNFIQWTSGYIGILQWNRPGFELSSRQSSIYFVFIFMSYIMEAVNRTPANAAYMRHKKGVIFSKGHISPTKIGRKDFY